MVRRQGQTDTDAGDTIETQPLRWLESTGQAKTAASKASDLWVSCGNSLFWVALTFITSLATFGQVGINLSVKWMKNPLPVNEAQSASCLWRVLEVPKSKGDGDKDS